MSVRPSDPGGHPEDPPGDPEKVARRICLSLLTTAPRTRAKLADALAAKGVQAEAAEAVLERFTEVGLIDDDAYARAWVSTRQAGRGLARRALREELARKGIDKEVAARALATVDPDAEEAAARTLIRRKLPGMRNLDPQVAARRLLGMLARRGHPSDLACRVVQDELSRVRTK